MQVDFWKHVNSLLLQALERPHAERPEFLDRACSGNDAVRREVEALLEAEPSSVQPIDRPAFELLAEPPAVLPAGGRIGPYRIEREIGRGGTGAVYLARRADGELRKPVAVKVLKRGMDTDEIVRRFRQERRILANLDHPNIARFFEGGTTEDHRPYLVMEYVDGEPIDQYCRSRSLAVHARLTLFLKVCAAVQLAHQNLVIHRDLKPSNILVTADGEPKLLDFGIAKLLDPADEHTETATTVGNRRLLTPDYASPEQVLARPMTTASDVYSLGVVLYELLTDQRPYRIPSPLEAVVRDVVCHREPRRPSASIPPAGVGDATRPEARRALRRRRRRLLGDLDNIVLMALAKEPRHRYATVDQLAHDIRCHLDGLPVHARRATFAYRAQKFLRRHVRETAVASMFLLLLGGFAVDRALQQSQLARERDRAEQERDRAEQVSRFVRQLFDLSRTEETRSKLTVRTLLDYGVEKIHEEFADEPEIQADLMMWICEGYASLGLSAPSEPLLRGALRLRRQVYGHVHPKVAESLDKLAGFEAHNGRFRQQEALYRQSLAIRRQLYGDDSAAVVKTRLRLGVALMDQGRLGEAEPLLRDGLDDLRRLEGPSESVAAMIGNLAILLHQQGRFEQAAAYYREAWELSLDLLGHDDGQVTANMQNLASCLRDEGRLDEAEPIYRRLLEIHDRRYGDNHPATAAVKHNLGLLLLLRGDLAAAEALVDEALELESRFSAEDHPRIAYWRLTEARLRLARGDAAAAEPLAAEALETLRGGLSEEHWKTQYARGVLGTVLASRGRYDEAEALLLESYGWLSARLSAEAWPVRETLRWLEELYDAWGRPRTSGKVLG